MTVKIIEDLKNKKVYLKIDRLGEITRQSIRKSFYLLGKDLVRTTSKAILKKPKGGRVYIRVFKSGVRRRHRASAPGETHANMSGALRRSLGYKIGGSISLEFGYGVDKPAPKYGKWVEFGTRKMAARPSLQNAIQATSRNAETYVGNQFVRLVK